jgi:hypothetical protein
MSAWLPLFLYNGTIFVFLQVYGAWLRMADSFKNLAIGMLPAGPICLMSWRGRGLRPELLFA